MAILSYFINEIYKLKINFTLQQVQIQHRKLNKPVISENDLCNVASRIYRKRKTIIKGWNSKTTKDIGIVLEHNAQLLKLDQYQMPFKTLSNI